MNYVDMYLYESSKISNNIDRQSIERAIEMISQLNNNEGRLFIMGVGGSAANASHAVNDFRKLAGIESYAPTDNVAEITARTNDEGWETTFLEYLRVSKLKEQDVIFVFSVGGGSENTSQNIVAALNYAKECKAKIISIVSRDGGYAMKCSDICMLIPVVNDDRITPHAEEWQAILWHLIVNGVRRKDK